MQKVFFDYEDYIIDPCWDGVFKAIFTKDRPESRGALQKLLSAIIGRDLAVLTITANEPPVDSIKERQIRYDINCKFDSGELCNIEMTLDPDAFELIRLEYYSSKLFVSQDIRGRKKTYNDLRHTYQISLIVNATMINDDNEFAHHFQYYDKERGVSLNGRTHIIVLELSKLEETARKPVTEMTSLERWALFFKLTTDKGKRELVNEIIMCEEGIAMAGEVLLTISKDEKERARLTSEYKYAVDMQSKMVGARREGEAVGEARGRQEEKMETVGRLLKKGYSEADVADAMELPLSKVLEIKGNILK
jgi:predicted transposase/invertase (TIGR01784 family)